jgi:hypothetical protein
VNPSARLARAVLMGLLSLEFLSACSYLEQEWGHLAVKAS